MNINFSRDVKIIGMGVEVLGKIKIHEIAKEIGLASKEVVERGAKFRYGCYKSYEQCCRGGS